VLTGVIYLVENRSHVRNIVLSFYRAIVPLN